MEGFKALFFKPDPAEQLRKCNQLIRKNTRQLDRHIADLNRLEKTAKNQILAASRRGRSQETRVFAREMLKIRKQAGRLSTSKAQLQSVGMQVNEAFSVRKIQGSIKASTGIMKDVNQLVRLPELTGTMHELSRELIKAGIIEELVDDVFEPLDEEDEAEAEVDKVLGEILRDKMATVEVPDDLPETEVVLDAMRDRLEALKS